MCLIITIIMLGLSIQNFIAQNWLVGFVQFIIALGFVLLLINNIRKTKAMRDGTCYNGCEVTNWAKRLFKR